MDEKEIRLYERIRHIEEELADVKKELKSMQFVSGQTDVSSAREKLVITESVSARPALKKEKKERNQVSIEQLISDWLPRVFIFVFIFGIIWAFIAAIDKGWISPSVRVLIGFAVAGLLYWLGDRQYHRTKNALGIVLLGGSIVVYIVSVFAGNVLYEIIPYLFTLFLLAAGILLGVWLSRKYQSESLLAIIGIGAYLYPFLFAGDRGTESIFYLYETLIFAGLILESIQKQYKTTWTIANYAFIFAVLFFIITGVGTASLITFVALAFQQILIIFLTFQVQHPASKGMYISAISTGAFFLYLIGEDVFGSSTGTLYPFYLITAAIYGILSIARGKSHHELKNVFFVFSMFYLFVFFSQLFTEAIHIQLIVYTVQAMAVYYLAQKRKSMFGTVGSFLLLLPVLNQLSELPGYLLTYPAIICWILVIGFFLTIYMYREKTTMLNESWIRKIFPYLTGAFILAFFSKVAGLITSSGNYMYDDIGLSVSWMIFVAVMYAAYSFFGEKHWQYIGLAFLFLTLGKLVLYDLVTVDLVWRAVLFIGLGSIGLFISRIFYNKSAKE